MQTGAGAQSHTGFNLAAAFAQVLNDFGIEHKVSQPEVLGIR